MVGGKRETLFDSIKFYLIVLVIFGHTSEMNNSSGLVASIYNFIYMFHMPLFVFISGYFNNFHSDKKLKKSILKLLETFVIFNTFHWLFSRHIPESIISLLSPGWTLWYLLSFTYWKVITFVLPVRKHMVMSLILSFIIGIAVGFVPLGNILAITRTCFFLPFFLLGMFVRDTDLIIKIRKTNIIYSILILLIALSICLMIKHPVNWLTYGSISYYGFEGLLAIPFVGRFCFYITAILLSISFIRLVKETQYSSVAGKNTLFFYVYHPFLIWVVSFVANHLKININLMFIILVSASIVIVLYMLMNNKYLMYLLNPISNYHQTLKNNKQ